MPRLFSAYNPSFRRPAFLVFGAILVLVLASGGSVYWWRGPTVLLTVDGHTRRVVAKKGTVSDVLYQQHVRLGPEDFTSPLPTTFVQRDQTIQVIRVTERLDEIKTHSRPRIEWSHRTHRNLRRILVQKGTWTERVQQLKITSYDGVVKNRQILKDSTTRKTFFTLTLFTPNGYVLKKYDLLAVPQFTMLATAYYVGDPTVPSDTTKMGFKLRRGLVAVDPTVIPLGSRLYIPGYGYSYAADTGSAIKKSRIDLAVKDKDEERLYGHRHMTVYVLEKAPRW